MVGCPSGHKGADLKSAVSACIRPGGSNPSPIAIDILRKQRTIIMYLSLQGNMGLGKAIEYFTSHQIPISIPINDTQPYDLVADINGKLSKIQVKTTRHTLTNGQSYEVQLRNTGGNRTGSTRVVPFDNSSCDYVFVYTGAEKLYLIPADKITSTTAISVGIKYKEYEVFSKKLLEFINEIS